MVSILCATYNHELYLERAVDGFLNQETDFAYEIIIHDDASVDNTRRIIEKYARDYPDAIKPIYQTENQYSKGKKITLDFMVPKSRGKYVALCEGDDFWMDSHKLQKQVDYMESHPKCSLVVHDAVRVFENGATKGPYSAKYSLKGSRILTLDNVVSDLGAFPLASMMFRRSFYCEHFEFLNTVRNFDYLIKTMLATSGYVYYIGEAMAAYRENAKGSWSERVQSSDEKAVEHLKESIVTFEKLDSYTLKAFSSTLKTEIERRKIIIAVRTSDKSIIKKPYFRKYLRNITVRSRVRIIMKVLVPSAYKHISRLFQQRNSVPASQSCQTHEQ